MEEEEQLLPVGIDLGSYYARIAIIPNITASSSQTDLSAAKNDKQKIVPNILANPQTGLRYTLALSTVEDSDTTATPEPKNNNKNGSITNKKDHYIFGHYIFGDIAHRHLSRSHTLDDISAKLFVRKQSSSRCVLEEDEDKEKKNGKEISNNEEDASSIAFIQYLCDIAFQGYNTSGKLSPSSLRIVLAIPSYYTPTETKNIISSCQNGILSLVAQKEGKNKRRKCIQKGIQFVSSVITDASSVCIAHGLTDVVASTEWKYAWVMNWGNSGFTITTYKNTCNKLHRLDTCHDTTISTKSLQAVFTQYVIMEFLRKYRLPMSTTTAMQQNKKCMFKLHGAIENAIRTFVRTTNVTIHVDSLYDGLDLNVVVSRPRFEMLCNNILQRVQSIIVQKLQSQKEQGMDTIDVVLMSGSAFQTPKATQMINNLFPNATKGNNSEDPFDEVVAVGCAKYAKQLMDHLLVEKEESGDEISNDAKNNLCMDVPVCPFVFAVAYPKDGGETKNGKGCSCDGKPIDDEKEWVIVPFEEENAPLPIHSTKSISFSNMDKEVPCCAWIIQKLPEGIRPLAKIPLTKEDLKNDVWIVSLDIDLEGTIRFTNENSGECVSL